jgi:5,10-methenyltetrahydromethanopterin hydrogenase
MSERDSLPRRNERYELSGGKILHRWTDQQGQSWACMQYDHGPMCRLCQPVVEVLEACLQNLVDGMMEARQTEQGFEFKMTDEGNRQAAKLIRELADDA